MAHANDVSVNKARGGGRGQEGEFASLGINNRSIIGQRDTKSLRVCPEQTKVHRDISRSVKVHVPPTRPERAVKKHID